MLCRGEYYAPNLTRHAEVFVQQTLRTKGEAEDLAVEVRRAIRLGTYVAAKDYTPPAPAAPPPTTTAPAPGQTLDAIVTLFETLQIDADVKKKKNSKTNDKANLKRLCRTVVPARPEPLGTWPMAALTLQDLIAFRSEQEGLATSTWNKIRTTIGQLWSWARWQGHLERDILVDAPKPALKLLGRTKANQRNQRIDDALWSDLLAAAEEGRTKDEAVRLGDLLIALWETGARVGELLALQWGDVHRDQKQLYIRGEEIGAGKTGSRPIEISTVLDAILARRSVDPAGQPHKRRAYVFGDPFGGRIKSVDKTWRTTLLRAHRLEPGWTETGDFDAATRARLHHIDLHLHDIRHEAACRWLESRCFDLAQISKRLGHSSVAQTATYLHARDSSLRGAQAAYDAKRQADAEAAEAQAKAAAGLKPGSSPYKVHTNGSAASSLGLGPRLVKSDKSSVKK
jgi:integrase